MNARTHPPAGRRDGPYRRALERLEECLGHHSEHRNAELIRRMRQLVFAEVDGLERSGPLQLPDRDLP